MASINATTSSGIVATADNTGQLQLQTTGVNAVTIDTSQNVGIGTTSPTSFGSGYQVLDVYGSGTGGYVLTRSPTVTGQMSADGTGLNLQTRTNHPIMFNVNNSEKMRITSSGDVLVAKTSASSATLGCELGANGQGVFTASSTGPLIINRLTDDGTLVSLRQAGTEEGTISVSGTTVSYNGGHLSRWSQWQNETGKPEVYRGTVLESVDAMCVWEKDGQPLPNEQATKTIISTTPSSKAVAGVFDRYDEDDETNPYDFYVAQSGDFVIRIAQGVTVQNGDLLESAGDGTARPQADDICRSSTIAKVTSNYVSATYEDGSYCVPCILMIG